MKNDLREMKRGRIDFLGKTFVFVFIFFVENGCHFDFKIDFILFRVRVRTRFFFIVLIVLLVLCKVLFNILLG